MPENDACLMISRKKLLLPPVMYGPVRTGLGVAQCVLHDASNLTVLPGGTPLT